MVSASLQRALLTDCLIALLLSLADKEPKYISSIRHPVNQSIRQMKRKTDKLFRVLGFAAIIFLLAVIALKFVASKKNDSDGGVYCKHEATGRCPRAGVAGWPKRFDIDHSVAQHGYRAHQYGQPVALTEDLGPATWDVQVWQLHLCLSLEPQSVLFRVFPCVPWAILEGIGRCLCSQ